MAPHSRWTHYSSAQIGRVDLASKAISKENALRDTFMAKSYEMRWLLNSNKEKYHEIGIYILTFDSLANSSCWSWVPFNPPKN